MRVSFMMILLSGFGLASAAAQTATKERARPVTDWPCKSIKVPSLSLAAVWSGPPITKLADVSWHDDAALRALVVRLAARRTPIEGAQQAIDDFANAQGNARHDRLLQLFAAVFDTMASERAQVVAGLDRLGHRQQELADTIRTETAAMRAEQDKPAADAAKTDALANQLTWDLRIFDDKNKSVTYVCETPVLIEQRLFALGRMIAKALE